MNGDQPAFPCHLMGMTETLGQQVQEQFPGMTYRQWLAGMALQGMLAGNADEVLIEDLVKQGVEPKECGEHVPKLMAEDAWELADALIAAEKGEGK